MVDPAHTDGKLILRWLWGGYLRRFLGLIFAALFLMGIEGSMMGALSYTIGPMFDELFVARNRAALPWIAGAIFAVFVLRALSGFGQRVLMAKVGQRLTADLQSDMVRHMLGLDLAWFQKTPPGNLIERVRGDTNALAMRRSAVVCTRSTPSRRKRMRSSRSSGSMWMSDALTCTASSNMDCNNLTTGASARFSAAASSPRSTV